LWPPSSVTATPPTPETALSFASFKSRVLNPSENHPYTEANSSRASLTLPRSRQRREAYGGAEFPGFDLLLAGDGECMLENMFLPSQNRSQLISARPLPQRGGPRSPTNCLWLFRLPPSHRQCIAKRPRTGRGLHWLSPNLRNEAEETKSLPLIVVRSIQK
jgi:hypothetical protein